VPEERDMGKAPPIRCEERAVEGRP
jgi:hypothetical protein